MANQILRLAIFTFVVLQLACSTSASRSQKQVEHGKQLVKANQIKDAATAFKDAIKLNPKNGDAYYQMALLGWNFGEPGIDGNLRRTIDLQPQNVDAIEKLAEIQLISYQRHNDPQWRKTYLADLEALSTSLRLIDSKAYQSQRMGAYVALYSGEYEKAIAGFQQALATNPKAPSAHAVAGDLVRAFIGDKRLPEAESFEQSYTAQNPDAKPVYEALAGYYETHEAMPKAIQVLQKRADANPREPDAQLSLAAIYQRAGQQAEMERTLDRLRSDPEAFPQGLELAGDFYTRIGEFPNAVKSYQLSEAQQPGRKEQLRIKQAELLRRQHQYAAALRAVEALGSKNPDAALLRYAVLADLHYPKDLDQSIRELEQMRQTMPRDGRVAVQLGRAYLAKGRVQDAGDAFGVGGMLSPDSADPLLGLARWNEAKRDYVHMREAMVTASDIDSRNLDVIMMRGIAAAYTAETGEARRSLEYVLQRIPGEPEAEYHLARTSAAEGRYKDAEAAFRKLADAGNPRALIGLADVYTREKNHALAMQTLDRAMKSDPNNLELKQAYASAAMAAGRYDEAIQYIAALKAQSPANAQYRLMLINAYRAKSDDAAALKEAQEAEQAGIKDTAVMIQLAELTRTVKRDLTATLNIYQSILKADPENPTAGARTATLMIDSGGNTRDALTIAERASSNNPLDPEVMASLAYAYSFNGYERRSIELFKNLIERNPNDGRLRLAYASALVRSGQKDRAKQELESALRANLPADQAAAVRDKLDRL